MKSNHELIRSQILALVKKYHAVNFAPKSFDSGNDLVHYAGRVFDAEEIVNLVDASLDFYLTAKLLSNISPTFRKKIDFKYIGVYTKNIYDVWR